MCIAGFAAGTRHTDDESLLEVDLVIPARQFDDIAGPPPLFCGALGVWALTSVMLMHGEVK